MELVRSEAFPWVAFTQVGDALTHGQWGLTNCASSDRFVGLAPVAVAEAEHEEVAELVLLVLDSIEGRADPQLVAEFGPFAEDLVLGMLVLDDGAPSADLQSSAEVSSEAACGVKWSSFQGASCG